jgi:hypothetical protein
LSFKRGCHFGNLASPPGDEIIADDVVSDVSSVFRLRAYRVLAKVSGVKAAASVLSHYDHLESVPKDWQKS